MLSADWWRKWKAHDRWIHAAVVLWAAVLMVVSTRAAIRPQSPSLFYLWRNSGESWVHGKTLYNYEMNIGQGGFRYGPPYAVLFVLLYWLPISLGAVLWRLANAAALLAALGWWLRSAAPVSFKGRQEGLFFTIAAILSVSNLHPGQLNLLLAALILVMITAAQQQRWGLAALATALGALMKIYPLAFGLLLLAVHPRKMGWRLPVMLLVVACLPFLFQQPHYVLSQYIDWFALVSQGDRSRRFLPYLQPETYRDLLLLLRLLGLPITLSGYALVQAVSGLACAAFCVAARFNGVPSRVVLFHVLMLGSLWMTLCGPASEPRTYGLLIPTLTWWFVWTYERGPGPARFLASVAMGSQLLAAFAPVSGAALYYFHAGGLMPLSALTLLASYFAALPAQRCALIEEEAAAPNSKGFGSEGSLAA
jgi:hypothetical protein